MPYVFSDPLRDEIVTLLRDAEKHANTAKEKKFIMKLKDRVLLMPKWRPGQNYAN